MPIDVQWSDEEPHIIYWTMTGLWSLSDFDSAIERSITLVAQSGAASYVYDLQASKLMPPHIVRHIRQLSPSYLYRLKANLAIVVGADQFLRLFLNALIVSLHVDFDLYYATSREDAEQFLHQYNAANRA